MTTIRRLLFAIMNLRTGYHELNRRAKVEQEMWDCINGKSMLPGKEKLRDWAVRLGIPPAFRSSSTSRQRLLEEAFLDYYTQYRCGCGHPHCNNCERDRHAERLFT